MQPPPTAEGLHDGREDGKGRGGPGCRRSNVVVGVVRLRVELNSPVVPCGEAAWHHGHAGDGRYMGGGGERVAGVSLLRRHLALCSLSPLSRASGFSRRVRRGVVAEKKAKKSGRVELLLSPKKPSSTPKKPSNPINISGR